MSRLQFKAWLSVLLLAGMARHAWAQARYLPRYVEPKWFTFRISQISAGAYAEAVYQQSSYDGSDANYSYTRTFIGPTLGLNGIGSIYHPNLLSYTLVTDGALGWSRDESSGGGTRVTTDQLDYFGTVMFSLDLLSRKPFGGTGFLDYNHSYRDNDFYSTVLVESWRYGGKLRYNEEPWRLNASYQHRQENSTSQYPVQFLGSGNQVVITRSTQDSRIDEDSFFANASHTRLNGETTLDYYLTSYQRADYGQTGDGLDQTVGLSDTENFGGLDRYVLHGRASYITRDNNYDGSDEIQAELTFNAQHLDNLQSYYDLSYSHYTSGDYVSDGIFGQAALNHRLYESLYSGISGRISDFDSSSGSSEGYSRTIGGTLSEDYRKWLSTEHRLSLGAAVSLDHTDQQSIGIVENERHTVTATGEPGAPQPYSFYLNAPNVNLLSIVITDQRDAPPFYVPGFDYQVTQLGSRTLIVWLRPLPPGGSLPVLVDYEAQPTPGGTYETISQNYLVRFELWRNLLGLYARAGLSDNNAPLEMLVPEYWTYAVGADLRYKAFQTGAEYQYYDSTDTEYNSIRLYQGYGISPDAASSLSFNFNEMWIRYLDQDRYQDIYSFMVHYYRHVTSRLGITVEAGTSYTDSDDIEQLLATFRPSLRYWIGRTTIEAGYLYQYELFFNREERQKHMLNVRLKRVF